MKKINLLLIKNAPVLGGAEIYNLNLAKELLKKGVNIYVVTPLNELKKGFEDLGIQTKKMNWGEEASNRYAKLFFILTWPFYVLRFFFLLKKFKKEKDINLVFLQSLNEKLIITPIAKKLGISVVWIEHGPLFNWIGQFAWYYKKESLKVDKIIAVSNMTREDLINNGIDSQKIILIYNGINIDKFPFLREDQKEKRRKQLGLKENEKVVGYVGRLNDEKGVIYFLEAAYDIIKELPYVKIFFVGSGPQMDFLKKKAKDLNIENHVKFLGFRKNIPDILSIFDVYVLPSKIEGLPLGLIEAMSMGIPIVASNVGGVPEAIIDRKTGILVPPKDPKLIAKSVIYLLNNEDKAQILRLAGRKEVEQQFSIEKMVYKTIEVFQEAINKEIK